MLYNEMKETKEEERLRKMVKTNFEGWMKENGFKEFKIEMIGSSKTKTNLPGSDVDLSIDFMCSNKDKKKLNGNLKSFKLVAKKLSEQKPKKNPKFNEISIENLSILKHAKKPVKKSFLFFIILFFLFFINYLFLLFYFYYFLLIIYFLLFLLKFFYL